MSDCFLALHGLAIKKFGTPAGVAAVLGEDEAAMEAALAAAVAAGEAMAARGTYMVTPKGQAALKAAYPEQFAALRADPDLAACYERFETMNAVLKQLMTDWQVTEVAGEPVSNDHSDKAYDARIIDRLGTLHEQMEPVLAAFAASLPRLARYAERLEAALAQAEDGEIAYVSGARIDSYHTVWFELHEELLRILDRTRQE